jgi:hypothetical protein
MHVMTFEILLVGYSLHARVVLYTIITITLDQNDRCLNIHK